jgi:uncharacterized protein YjiS (DUF1127 family)
MRDPNKNVTFVFRCYEKESADLKIRLKYDGLQQGEFFRSILKMYVSQDPLVMTVVEEIKKNKKTMGRRKLTSTSKDLERGKKLLSDLGITESDKQDIFDMIEMDLGEYE